MKKLLSLIVVLVLCLIAVPSFSADSMFLMDENGSPYGIKQINNKPRVVSSQYFTQISEGAVPGHNAVFKFGENSDVGTSEETIWKEGGFYPWDAVDAAEGIVTLSSSSTLDVNTTGTGAWTATIYGLSTGGIEQNETLNLNGQNAVNSTLEYSRVNRIIVNTAGTGNANAGIVYVGTGTITTGKPAVVWASAAAGLNQTLQAVWTVPTGKTFFMTSAEFSVSGARGGQASIYVRPPGELFQIKYRSHLAGGPTFVPFNFALVYASGTDIEMRASAGQAGSEVGGTFSGWEE